MERALPCLRDGDISDREGLAVAAEIIRFGDYRGTRDVAPACGDIEARPETRPDIQERLTRLNALAAEVFRALNLDLAAMEFNAAQRARSDR